MTDIQPSLDPQPESPKPDKSAGRRDWIIGLIAIILLVVGPIVIFTGVRSSVQAANADDPWAKVPTGKCRSIPGNSSV